MIFLEFWNNQMDFTFSEPLFFFYSNLKWKTLNKNVDIQFSAQNVFLESTLSGKLKAESWFCNYIIQTRQS